MRGYIGPKYLRPVARGKFLKAQEKPKSLSVLKCELQELFNEFIRLRDTKYDKADPYFICISCWLPKPLNEMHAGHYYPVGNNEAIRYHEKNCAGQCVECNITKHGNQDGYRGGLLIRYGKEVFEELDALRHSLAKFSRDEILSMIEEYKVKVQQLKKSHG